MNSLEQIISYCKNLFFFVCKMGVGFLSIFLNYCGYNKYTSILIHMWDIYMLVYLYIMKSESCSVVSDSLQPHGLHSPWNSPGQNTGVGSLSRLQGIFPTQGSNPGLPHCRQILYHLSHQETYLLHQNTLW